MCKQFKNKDKLSKIKLLNNKVKIRTSMVDFRLKATKAQPPKKNHTSGESHMRKTFK